MSSSCFCCTSCGGIFSLIGLCFAPGTSFPVAESKNDAKVIGLSSCVTWHDCTEPPPEVVRRSNGSYITISPNVWAALTHSPLSGTSCKKLGGWEKDVCILKLCRSDNQCCLCLGNHVPSSKFVIQPTTFLSFPSTNKCTHRNLLLVLELVFFFFFSLRRHC